MIIQITLSFILIMYAIFVSFVTKKTYDFMISKGVKRNDAIYYNRKLVHILAGGVIALFVPLFLTPLFPLLSGIILAIFTFYSHKRNQALYWFQHKRDFNDVSFCLMWGFTVFILWNLTGSPWLSIIPIVFMAFGDGITGIVRNIAFKERKKHPIGNIYMAGVSIPIGYFFGHLASTYQDNIIEGMAFWGVVAALVASVFERYEFGPIDDNFLITISATAVLIIGGLAGPIL